MMKTLILALVAVVGIGGVALSAPVESVESGCGSIAKQRVDAYLAQQTVARQLQTLGVSHAQIDARLARLSETQLESIAAQIDMLQAGGTIQHGNPRPLGPLHCILEPAGRFFYDLFQLFVCWGKLK